jgi:DNA uptake protein ComE-like DNA-binding protein
VPRPWATGLKLHGSSSMGQPVAAMFRVALLVLPFALTGCPRSSPQALDLNSAPPDRLEKLGGISPADAARIVAGRPYASKEDLLSRKVVSRELYDQIAPELYVGPPGIPDYLRSVPPMPEGP